MGLGELRERCREDWEVHGRPFPLASPGFQTIALYRFGTWARQQAPPQSQVYLALHRVASTLCRNVYGIEVSPWAVIGRRCLLGHQSGIVIGRGVTIGDDCVVRQNVTIGTDQRGGSRRPAVIGDGVEIGAGAVILAGVTVGDGARIGPNAVVMKDVPAGESAFAPPARIMAPLRHGDPSTD